MIKETCFRQDAIDALVEAVVPGKATLSESEYLRLQTLSARLIRTGAEAGLDELQRFRDLRHRELAVDPIALDASHSGRTIIVTGGTGCIGSNVLAELVQHRPARLVSVSRGLTPPWAVVDGVEYHYQDVRDDDGINRLFDHVKPDTVFHLAAQHNPGLAESTVAHTLSTNVAGSWNIFNACRDHGSQVVHASTGKALRPFSSDIYAASKKISEWLLQHAMSSGDLAGSVARFTHVVDNSIIYHRLEEWTRRSAPVRLHDPHATFYLQSALEAAQLLLCMSLEVHRVRPALGAINDLGWPCSLVDLAVGWLAQNRRVLPIYFCGQEAGYQDGPYPGLYDPRFSGAISPLLNSFEGAEAAPSVFCPQVDLSVVRADDNPRTLRRVTDLVHTSVVGGSESVLHDQVRTAGWAVLSSVVSAAPRAVLERQLELVQALPTDQVDRRSREVIDLISFELRERELTDGAAIGLHGALDRKEMAMTGPSRGAEMVQSTVLVKDSVHNDRAGNAFAGSVPAGDRALDDVGPSHDDTVDVTDAEKVLFFGPQRRWYLVLRFVAFLGLILSLIRFTYNDARVSALLVVILPLTAVSVVSLYTSTRGRRMSLNDHRNLVAGWRHRSDPAAPAVDVFLPSAGEPLDVLAKTYERVKRLVYPGPLAVYVLDDGARIEVAQLAERYGFTYLTRPDRGRLKKAGNLEFGYSRSTGDVIAVFDADFAPRPDYLLELMPYLEDPTLGIVQSPQYFQTHGLTSWLQRAAGATQELFYRWVQPSRDAIGAPICVGTCALYRRSALRDAGGFAQMEHSEDVHTGVKILAAGYFVRYVPIILAKGICPDSFAAFISQQYRWCCGSMSLMTNPDFRRMPLKRGQRLCFWSGFGYYITTVLSAFGALIPPIFLLWIAPEAIHPQNYLWLVPAMLVYPLIMMLHCGDWRLSVLRVQLVYSYSHAVAIWDTYRGGTAEWVATGAVQQTPLSTKVIRLMAGWILITQTALWAGIAHVLLDGTIPALELLPLLALAAMSAYIQLPIVPLVRSGRAYRAVVPTAGLSSATSG